MVKLQEKVFLTQPTGFEDPNHPDHVCCRHKALYGLKQALWAWYMKLSSCIQKMGFQRCPYDTSLFSGRQGIDIIILLIYDDDIIITRSSATSIDNFLSHMSIVFHMKDPSALHYFLGLQIT